MQPPKRKKFETQHYSLVLHPEEMLRPSRVGLYNECISLVTAHFTFLPLMLRNWSVGDLPQPSEPATQDVARPSTWPVHT